MYTFIKTSCLSLEILDVASACNPVRALEAQYVFNSGNWQGLGDNPKKALAALGQVSPLSQTRSQWNKSGGMIGIISITFYPISLPLSSISNWGQVTLGLEITHEYM